MSLVQVEWIEIALRFLDSVTLLVRQKWRKTGLNTLYVKYAKLVSSVFNIDAQQVHIQFKSNAGQTL